MNKSIRYIIYAFIIVLLQVTVIKNIIAGTILAPYLDIFIYPLLVFILPVNAPATAVVVLSFVCGITLDFFYATPGVHTSALVFTGFIRKYMLNRLEPRNGYAIDDVPLKVRRASPWYFIYAGILLSIHIFIYFLVSYFSLYYILQILMKSVLTFFVSMLLISLHGVAWRALN